MWCVHAPVRGFHHRQPTTNPRHIPPIHTLHTPHTTTPPPYIHPTLPQVACTPLLEPIHLAASMGHDEACTLLLQADASVNAAVNFDRTLVGISRLVCVGAIIMCFYVCVCICLYVCMCICLYVCICVLCTIVYEQHHTPLHMSPHTHVRYWVMLL